MSLAALFVAQRPFFDLAALMLRIDVFAFGGGFASVPLMFNEVVTARQWLDGPTLLDGLAASGCLGHQLHVRLTINDGRNSLV